jgi:hypothetical protein
MLAGLFHASGHFGSMLLRTFLTNYVFVSCNYLFHAALWSTQPPASCSSMLMKKASESISYAASTPQALHIHTTSLQHHSCRESSSIICLDPGRRAIWISQYKCRTLLPTLQVFNKPNQNTTPSLVSGTQSICYVLQFALLTQHDPSSSSTCHTSPILYKLKL